MPLDVIVFFLGLSLFFFIMLTACDYEHPTASSGVIYIDPDVFMSMF